MKLADQLSNQLQALFENDGNVFPKFVFGTILFCATPIIIVPLGALYLLECVIGDLGSNEMSTHAMLQKRLERCCDEIVKLPHNPLPDNAYARELQPSMLKQNILEILHRLEGNCWLEFHDKFANPKGSSTENLKQLEPWLRGTVVPRITTMGIRSEETPRHVKLQKHLVEACDDIRTLQGNPSPDDEVTSFLMTSIRVWLGQLKGNASQKFYEKFGVYQGTEPTISILKQAEPWLREKIVPRITADRIRPEGDYR